MNGEELKKFRDSMNLSQLAFGRWLGDVAGQEVTNQTIWRWENGGVIPGWVSKVVTERKDNA